MFTLLTLPPTSCRFAPWTSPRFAACAKAFSALGSFAPGLGFAGDCRFKFRARVFATIIFDSLACHFFLLRSSAKSWLSILPFLFISIFCLCFFDNFFLPFFFFMVFLFFVCFGFLLYFMLFYLSSFCLYTPSVGSPAKQCFVK